MAQFRTKRLSKVLSVAREIRQSAFLVTKMRFASLSPIIFFNCRGWAGGFPAPNFLFFIPLEIDVEGTEMASKRSKMPPPKKKSPFSGDLDASLHVCGGFTLHFSGLFGAIRTNAPKT